MSLILSQINIYPIKSLGGISLPSSVVEERGLQYDRRWMLVDDNHQFLTQRKLAKMALLKVALLKEGLLVSTVGMPDLVVPFMCQTNDTIYVTVWEDTCHGIVVSPQANEWFSDALQLSCKLVFMPDTSIRPVDTRYALNDEFVSFADAYPFLLIGEASLADLNGRLDTPLPMNRFRPNLVVSTTTPFEEDTWKAIRIGDTEFYLVKPCARCVVTTIDQQTTIAGKEPLKTLSTYRLINNKVLFGQNVLLGKKGKHIQVGDAVTEIRNL
jgi:uncharacterized protein YcbX